MSCPRRCGAAGCFGRWLERILPGVREIKVQYRFPPPDRYDSNSPRLRMPGRVHDRRMHGGAGRFRALLSEGNGQIRCGRASVVIEKVQSELRVSEEVNRGAVWSSA